MDLDIIIPFLIIFILTILTIFLIYPSARFNRDQPMEYVYSPLWFISYCIIFYTWSVLCRESTIAYYLVYIFSTLQLISLLLLYYFMNKVFIYYFMLILSVLVNLVISIIYRKLIVFVLLLINIVLFFYFFQTIKNTTW